MPDFYGTETDVSAITILYRILLRICGCNPFALLIAIILWGAAILNQNAVLELIKLLRIFYWALIGLANWTLWATLFSNFFNIFGYFGK